MSVMLILLIEKSFNSIKKGGGGRDKNNIGLRLFLVYFNSDWMCDT